MKVRPMDLRPYCEQDRMLSRHDILTTPWFHATSISDGWFEGVKENQVMVHAGTARTAFDRRSFRLLDSDHYIYVLTVKASATICPVILEDPGDWPHSVNQRVYDDYDVYLYVNGYEHAGSVSIVAKPGALVVMARLVSFAAVLTSYKSYLLSPSLYENNSTVLKVKFREIVERIHYKTNRSRHQHLYEYLSERDALAHSIAHYGVQRGVAAPKRRATAKQAKVLRRMVDKKVRAASRRSAS